MEGREARNDLIMASAGLMVVGFARLGFNILVMRVWGAEVLGEANVAISSAFLLSIPISVIFAPYATQRIASARGAKQDADAAAVALRILAVMAVVTILAALYVVFAGAWIRNLLDYSVADTVAVGGFLAAYAAYSVVKVMLYSVSKVQAALLYEGVGGLLFVIVLGLMVLVPNWPLRWLLAPFIALYGTVGLLGSYALGVWISSRRRLEDPAPADGHEPVGGSYIAWNMAGSISSLSVRELAVVVAAQGWGPTVGGWFALIASLVAPLSFLPRTLSMVLFPRLSELSGRRDTAGGERITARVTGVLAVLGTFSVGGLALVSGTVLRIAGAPSDPQLITALWLVSFGSLSAIVAMPAINARMGRGEASVPGLSSIAGLVAAIVIWSVGLSAFIGPGVVWVAGGFAAASLLRSIPPALVEPAATRGIGETVRQLAWIGAALTLGFVVRAAIGEIAAGAVYTLVGFPPTARWTLYRLRLPLLHEESA